MWFSYGCYDFGSSGFVMVCSNFPVQWQSYVVLFKVMDLVLEKFIISRGCGYVYMVGIVLGLLVFLLLASFLRPRRNNGMSFYMGIGYGFTPWYQLGNVINGQSLFKWMKDWRMVMLLQSVSSMFYLATQIRVERKIILTSLMAFLYRYW